MSGFCPTGARDQTLGWLVKLGSASLLVWRRSRRRRKKKKEEEEQEEEEEEEAEDKTFVSYFSFSSLVLHVGHTNTLRDLVPLSLSDEALMPFNNNNDKNPTTLSFNTKDSQ